MIAITMLDSDVTIEAMLQVVASGRHGYHFRLRYGGTAAEGGGISRQACLVQGFRDLLGAARARCVVWPVVTVAVGRQRFRLRLRAGDGGHECAVYALTERGVPTERLGATAAVRDPQEALVSGYWLALDRAGAWGEGPA